METFEGQLVKPQLLERRQKLGEAISRSEENTDLPKTDDVTVVAIRRVTTSRPQQGAGSIETDA
jgi:hypothetical protein